MKRVPVSEIFDIPKFYYFESKNIYTGSKGNFNYKIIPGETLVGQVWHGKLCSMKATIEQEQSFSMNQYHMYMHSIARNPCTTLN